MVSSHLLHFLSLSNFLRGTKMKCSTLNSPREKKKKTRRKIGGLTSARTKYYAACSLTSWEGEENSKKVKHMG